MKRTSTIVASTYTTVSTLLAEDFIDIVDANADFAASLVQEFGTYLQKIIESAGNVDGGDDGSSVTGSLDSSPGG